MVVCIGVFFLFILSAGINCESTVIAERNLLKSGFHRELETFIDVSRDIGDSCHVGVREKIPPGAFPDLPMLYHWENLGGDTVEVNDTVDVEAFTEVSSPSVVSLFHRDIGLQGKRYGCAARKVN